MAGAGGEPPCLPKSCAELGACGHAVDDGCGELEACPACPWDACALCGAGTSCVAGSCVPNACVGVVGLPGPPAVPVADWPMSVGSADLDADGKVDLFVSGGHDSKLSVLFGLGDATFATPMDYAVEAGGALQGDVDADDDIDIIVGTLEGLRVLWNDGDGGFTLETVHPTDEYTTSYELGSFNDDSHLDLATATAWNGTFRTAFGGGDGSFTPAGAFPSGTDNFAVMARDLNGDSRADIVVSTMFTATAPNGGIGVLLNNGDGTFGDPVVYAVHSKSHWSVAVADLDGDERPDLVTSEFYDDAVDVLLNEGDGTFGEAVTHATLDEPGLALLADLNGDGHADLVLTSGLGFGPNGGRLGVMLGHGDGDFDTPLGYHAGAGINGWTVADVNSDQHPDLVTTNQVSGELALLLNRGDGSFVTPERIELDHPAVALTTGDLDTDGVPDLAIASTEGEALELLLSNAGALVPQAYPLGRKPQAVGSGDFNGDGVADLAVCEDVTNGSAVHLLINRGNGTFRSQYQPAGSGAFSLVSSDLNGDGLTDVAVNDYAAQRLQVLINAGGELGAAKEYDAGAYPTWLTTADLNGDQRTDLVAASYQGVSILLNESNADFGPATYHAVGTSNGKIAAVDVDHDGDVDLALPDTASTVVNVLVNDGSGGFGAPVPYGAGESPFALEAVDLDGDQHPDLVVSNGGNTDYVSVLFNHGDGTFEPPTRYLVGGGSAAALLAFDANRDGWSDLAAAVGTEVSILYGGCLPSW